MRVNDIFLDKVIFSCNYIRVISLFVMVEVKMLGLMSVWVLKGVKGFLERDIFVLGVGYGLDLVLGKYWD